MARTVVGTVTQVSPRGELVVKTGGPLAGTGPGTRLVDARKDRVGRVVDVIGPVAKPYLVVAAERGAGRPGLRLLGKELFRE